MTNVSSSSFMSLISRLIFQICLLSPISRLMTQILNSWANAISDKKVNVKMKMNDFFMLYGFRFENQIYNLRFCIEWFLFKNQIF